MRGGDTVSNHKANRRLRGAATRGRLLENIRTRALSIASLIQDFQDEDISEAYEDLTDVLYDVEIDRDALNIHLTNLWEVINNGQDENKETGSAAG
jgi:hypothetical protein